MVLPVPQKVVLSDDDGLYHVYTRQRETGNADGQAPSGHNL